MQCFFFYLLLHTVFKKQPLPCGQVKAGLLINFEAWPWGYLCPLTPWNKGTAPKGCSHGLHLLQFAPWCEIWGSPKLSSLIGRDASTPEGVTVKQLWRYHSFNPSIVLGSNFMHFQVKIYNKYHPVFFIGTRLHDIFKTAISTQKTNCTILVNSEGL